MTDGAKFIGAKSGGAAPFGPPAGGRVPSGQWRGSDFPALDLGVNPRIDSRDWTSRLLGRVENELCLDWREAPVRLALPRRTGWKSAMWFKAIEFHETDRPGFQEVRVCPDDADSWAEQRFGQNRKGAP